MNLPTRLAWWVLYCMGIVTLSEAQMEVYQIVGDALTLPGQIEQRHTAPSWCSHTQGHIPRIVD